jgi:hypothetical protein
MSAPPTCPLIAKVVKELGVVPASRPSRPWRSISWHSPRPLRDLCALCVPLLCFLAAVATPGCQSEPKVVSYKPFFTGLEGAASNTPPVLGSQHRPEIPEGATPDDGVIEEADGSTRLVARNAIALMAHIQRTLAEDEEALFVDQVLCEQTRLEFKERGHDPAESFRFLQRQQKDIRELFNRMPAGERSPMVIVTPLGPRAQRLKVTGLAAKDLKWTGFDMVFEGARWAPVLKDGKPVMKDKKQVMRFEPSNWRLRWFVE